MIPSEPGEFEHQRSTVFMEGTYSQRLPPKNDLLTRPATFSNSATKITSHLKKNMTFNHHAILESQIYMVFPPNRDSSNEIPCFSHCWYFTLFWGWFVSFGKRINEENQIKPTTIHTIHAPSMGLVTRSAGRFADLDRSAIAGETSTDSTNKGSETQRMAWQKMMKVPAYMAYIMTKQRL